MSKDPKFGVILPHFSEDCTKERIIDTTLKAEQLGFDSVWVRDHVFVPPEHRHHGGIEEDKFTEPLPTLSALSSVTSSITLGTAILIPIRNPIKLAQNLSTLSYLSDDRVIAGMGIGRWKQEFEALNMPFDKRPQLIKENYEVLNRLFQESDVEHEGEIFQFENVTINPQPETKIPLWYGGFSKIAMNRAVRIADGILPGRVPISEFEMKMDYLHDLEEEHDHELDVGLVPPFSVADSREEAEAGFNIPSLVDEADSYMAGDYNTKEDIRGYYIAGDTEECAAQIQEFVDSGLDHVILDMRHAFEDIEQLMETTADSVIPLID